MSDDGIEADLGRLSDDAFFIRLVAATSKAEPLTTEQRNVLMLCIEAYERSLKLSHKGFSFNGREDLKEDFEYIIQQVEEITKAGEK